uniref:Ig-like domain-containing protein n=1 Tax=Panagrolaimus sp. JU765 TaxID=591449 RepID=A0AC34QAG7_9BILA
MSGQVLNFLETRQWANFSLRLLFLTVIFGLMPVFECKKKLKEQDIIQRVLKDYDWRVRPRGSNESWPDTGGPVVVSVNIYLRSISKIDDVNMEYSVQFTFREEWWDARLAYERFADDNTQVPPFVVLATSDNSDLSQQIWMPDSFFQNEKEARRHLIDKPNVLIRIHPNGQILYSVRLSLVLSCPMSLEYYPLDRQTCLIDLASYAYTTDDIKYEWKKSNPIQQKEGLRQSLPSFELQDVLTDYCTSKTNTGTYSCLRTKMILRREFSYYLLQLYIPSFMLVIVSWVSFWLDKDSVPARVTLGVTTLLTMTTQSSGINAKLPPVSYTKAIDVWIGVCLAFIFGALLEFALVNYAARKDMTSSQRLLTAKHNQGHLEHHGYQPLTGQSTRSSSCFRFFVRRYKERSKRIDVVSRVVFPIGYACFNVLYWAVYLMRIQLRPSQAIPSTRIQLLSDPTLCAVLHALRCELGQLLVGQRCGSSTCFTRRYNTQSSGINAKLPPVSYIKAVDTWIGACLAFIFAALLEYALVNYYGRKEFVRKEKQKKLGGGLHLPIQINNDCICPPTGVPGQMIQPDRPTLRLDAVGYHKKSFFSRFKLGNLFHDSGEVSRRIDLVSRVTFPTLFCIFLVYYYATYVRLD